MLKEMRKILLIFLTIYLFSLLLPKRITAATCDFYTIPPKPYHTDQEVKLVFDVSGFTTKDFLCSFPGTFVGNPPAKKLDNDHYYCSISYNRPITRTVELLHKSSGAVACTAKTFTIYTKECTITITDPGGKYDINSQFNIKITEIFPPTLEVYGRTLVEMYNVELDRNPLDTGNPKETSKNYTVGPLSPGSHEVKVESATTRVLLCGRSFTVVDVGQPPPKPGAGLPTGPSDPCVGATGKALDSCRGCLGWNETTKTYTKLSESSWTALGCISTEPSGFVAWLLKRVIGIAGGIAFLLILYGGFQILTSTGDPEKLTSGKDIIVSALAGLLMIVFSVLLLRIIGVDILKIPGFG